ncbi:MAG: PrsW family glutamic-type intramembrane protease [Acidimicrobiales bacterium]
MPYALLPCIYLATLSGSVRPATPGWAYALYLAPLWAIAFWFLIRPGRVTREVLIAGVAIAAIVYTWLQTITINVNNGLNPASVGNAIAVGFNEESTKALPVLIVALFLLKVRKTKWDVRMWMWLGTVSGLVFGVVEASLYTSTSVVTIYQHPNTVIAEILSFAERVFLDGYQHAIWAGVSCFFIGIAVNYPKRRIALIVAGLTTAALLHAANDFVLAHFNSLALWIVVQTLSLLVFLGYTMSAEMIVRNVRRSAVFRGRSLLAEPPAA